MSLKEEFKKFVFRGNVVDLAIAVIVGGSFGKIVTAFVDDLVMPAVSPLMPGGDWRNYAVTPLHIKVGHFLGTVFDFLIVSLVIFLVLVKLLGKLTATKETPAAPATKTCPECLESVPAAARRCKFCTSAIAAILLWFLAPAAAHAQNPADPKFVYGQAEKVEEKVEIVEWKAQVKGGFMATGGNSQQTNASLSGTASRKAGDNKFALDVGTAYGQAHNRVGVLNADPTKPTVIESGSQIERNASTSTNNWAAKARYDRFLTENNATYAQGGLGADHVAGKKLFGGAQVGYSRQLFKNAAHLLVGEFGYDFLYETYEAANADGVSVHSARTFAGKSRNSVAFTPMPKRSLTSTRRPMPWWRLTPPVTPKAQALSRTFASTQRRASPRVCGRT